MSEAMKIVFGLICLIACYILTQYGIGWRIHRANQYVIKDLRRRKAFAAESAVELHYARKKNLNIGIRDFRPKAVETLLAKGSLGVTAEGRYYLRERFEDV